MAKRFTDTEKWTKNKWFRLLPTPYKLFWLFILDNCDCVGVWEEDIEFFCNLTGEKITKQEALIIFENQIMVMATGKKWWVIDFVMFQYGELKEENIKNKPHQKYISELKSHRLWIDYTKTIHSPQEKEKEEEKEEEKDKGGVGENETPAGGGKIFELRKIHKSHFSTYQFGEFDNVNLERLYKSLSGVMEEDRKKQGHFNPVPAQAEVIKSYQHFLASLPRFWKDKGGQLSTLSNNFNQILTEIQKNKKILPQNGTANLTADQIRAANKAKYASTKRS